MSDIREIPAQDQATREYLRILDLVSFTVEGYKKANRNQHGTRYHFEDGSWLSISDTNKTASTLYRTGLLAWHPSRIHQFADAIQNKVDKAQSVS